MFLCIFANQVIQNRCAETFERHFGDQNPMQLAQTKTIKNHWFLHHSGAPKRAPSRPTEAARGPHHRSAMVFERHYGDQSLPQLLKACCSLHKRKPSKTIGFCTILAPPRGPRKRPRRPQEGLHIAVPKPSKGIAMIKACRSCSKLVAAGTSENHRKPLVFAPFCLPQEGPKRTQRSHKSASTFLRKGFRKALR